MRHVSDSVSEPGASSSSDGGFNFLGDGRLSKFAGAGSALVMRRRDDQTFAHQAGLAGCKLLIDAIRKKIGCRSIC